MHYKRLWIALAVVVAASFAVLGGQEVGSMWGHCAYVAPDRTADWLHRESVFILDAWARAEGASNYEALTHERQAALRTRLASTLRATHGSSSGWRAAGRRQMLDVRPSEEGPGSGERGLTCRRQTSDASSLTDVWRLTSHA